MVLVEYYFKYFELLNLKDGTSKTVLTVWNNTWLDPEFVSISFLIKIPADQWHGRKNFANRTKASEERVWREERPLLSHIRVMNDSIAWNWIITNTTFDRKENQDPHSK